MANVPNITKFNHTSFTGTTYKIGPLGTSAAYRPFRLDRDGEFNIKVNDTFTNLRIVDNHNKVVADINSNSDIGQATAKLTAGNYTAILSQRMKGVNYRDYDFNIDVRQNALVTAGGGAIAGTALPVANGENGVQKHSLNVVQGGDFAFNVSLPGSRWSVLDKDGKLVASGDTVSKADGGFNVLDKTFKLEPGKYEVVFVSPSKLARETPWRMDLVPKVAGAKSVATGASTDPLAASHAKMQELFAKSDSIQQEWAQSIAKRG